MSGERKEKEKKKKNEESKALIALKKGKTTGFAAQKTKISDMGSVYPERRYTSDGFLNQLPQEMYRRVQNLRTSAHPEVVYLPLMVLPKKRYVLMKHIKCLGALKSKHRAAIMEQGREVVAMYIARVGDRKVSTFLPNFLRRYIASFLGLQISDLTKTGFGCLSDRKKHIGKTKREKEPRDL